MENRSAMRLRRAGLITPFLLLFTVPCFAQWTTSGNNIYNTNSGNVGINQTSPQAPLHVVGGAKFSGGPINLSTSPDSPGNEFYISRLGGTNQALRFKIYDTVAQIDYIEDNAQSRPGDIRFRLMRDGGQTYDVLTLAGNGGNVGIGTTYPTYKLDINGTARAAEIIVETSGADFVFDDDYDLRSLDEVERYIEEQGHLPEIPSAHEMQADGMRMGEMQTKLLQKIEELTLYLIEQERKDQEQEQTIAKLRQEMEYLKAGQAR